MDILLAHAYLLYEDPVEKAVMKPYPPLGILYLSAYLKGCGYDVGVYDATFAAREDFQPYLQKHRPTVVGIYVNMVTKFYALQMITMAKAIGATVIVGGPEPVHHAEAFLNYGADVVVEGEGEETLAELLPQLAQKGAHRLHGILGTRFLDENGVMVENGKRPRIRDINALPWPDRDAIDLGQYLNTWKTHHGRSSISLITARGCPFTCSWCSHAVYGHSHRRRRPEKVIEEIEYLKATYNPDQIWIADDVFTVSRAWSTRWSAMMKKRGLKIPYECISRADKLSEELAQVLAETGCYRVWFGSESGNQGLLDEMKRGVTLREIRQATRWVQRQGVRAGLFVMVGFGDEGPDEVDDTIRHLKLTQADDFLVTVAYPITGTDYHQALGQRVLKPKNWVENNDRSARFIGRPSDRYMRMATRYMIHEMAFFEAVNRPNWAYSEALNRYLKAKVFRLGMRLTHGRQRFEIGAPDLVQVGHG